MHRSIFVPVAILFLACTPAQDDPEPASTEGEDDDDGDGDDDDADDDDDGSTGADAPDDDGDDDDGDTTTLDTGTDTGAADTTGDAPTGDVWVDAEGTVLGLYRVVVDDDGDAVEGLVIDDVTWAVSTDHTVVFSIDNFGQAFFESNDCSGPVLVAEVPSFGSFRTGIVASAPGDTPPDYAPYVFVVPEGTERVEVEFASWIDWTYGCLDFEVGIYDNPPGSYYAEADLVFVQPPTFVPPLSIEHH